ncbi:MAG: lysine-sensitive aspartokinase 3 [Acidobacteriota bacterium]
MIVIKFGGTSVGDSERVQRAIQIVGNAVPRKPVVVVSALAGVTNGLVDAAHRASTGEFEDAAAILDSIRQRHEDVALQLVQQKSDYLQSFLAQLQKHIEQIRYILKGIALVGEVSPRANDKIVAIGEKLSSVLFAYSMRMHTLPGVHIDSEQVVVTDETFGGAMPLMDETRKAAEAVLLPEIERGHIPVMGGFIGRARSGATTTLGRGGSDYSASIIGAALGAEEIEIWTDVDGMMTSDPRVIASARVIDRISYEEAAELAYFGAKVLHPKTIAPAVEAGIPIRVLNTHNLDSRGTIITADGERGVGPRAIALKKDITSVHITSNKMLGAHGYLARIFAAFDRLKIPVDLITTSEVSVSLTVESGEHLEQLQEDLSPFANVEVRKGQAIIALVGRGVLSDPGTGQRIFAALGETPITMLSVGSSALNFSIVVPQERAETTMRNLHQALFEAVGAGAS